MKYYIIAGEASGDLHGANLIAALRKLDTKAEIRAWGGDLMEAQGAEIVKHYRDLAFMGFSEVIMNLRTILNNISYCKKDIQSFKPDAVILIDYPGFNLRMAQFAHNAGIKVFYYISPQIWAWKKGRVHTIKKVVDKMLVILPFEQDFYQQYDVDVNFVGHPLLDAIENHRPQTESDFRQKNGLDDRPIIALLPGSRKQEVSRMLETMSRMIPRFEAYQFVVGAAPSLEDSFYQAVTKGPSMHYVKGQTYDLLRCATAALVTSGTATLETALIGTPQVVCYKGSQVSYQIAKRLIHVKYISLVNLIMDSEVVTELIQNDFNEKRLASELGGLLNDQQKRSKMLSDYQKLREILGGHGASQKAASVIVDEMKPH